MSGSDSIDGMTEQAGAIPCVDCGQASIDGFWCAECHEAADDSMLLWEAEQGPCDWFERMLAKPPEELDRLAEWAKSVPQ